MNRIGERRQRSDRKIDVKSTMSIKLKDQLYDFAFLCREPVKEIAERLCINGMYSKLIVDDMQKWFRYDYQYGKTIAFGDVERPKLTLKSYGETGRVSMRFKQYEHDQLHKLARALDITVSASATTLIRVSTMNEEFMYKFVEGLQNVNYKERQKLMSFVRNYWIEKGENK